MYGWIWKKLPGTKWVKVAEAAALIAVAIALLFYVIFPLVNQWISELDSSTVV